MAMDKVEAELRCITLDAITRHTATVILLHGLGDSGEGMLNLAYSIQDSGGRSLGHVKWVLPTAPLRRITANSGAIMPAWFDLISPPSDMGVSDTEDEEGMMESVRALSGLVKKETKTGIPAERIVMAGFSQGGAMSLLTGLTITHRLAGLLVISSRVPLRSKFPMLTSENATSLPIFWAHGTADPLVPLKYALQCIDLLKSGIEVKIADQPSSAPGLFLRCYEGLAHTISREVIADGYKWLVQVLPESLSDLDSGLD